MPSKTVTLSEMVAYCREQAESCEAIDNHSGDAAMYRAIADILDPPSAAEAPSTFSHQGIYASHLPAPEQTNDE